MSVLTRADVRQNNVEGAERLKMMAKEEEARLLEERREGVAASRAMKKKMQEDRRKVRSCKEWRLKKVAPYEALLEVASLTRHSTCCSHSPEGTLRGPEGKR